MIVEGGGTAVLAAGVRYCYQEGSLALDGVDFRVARGEFVALLASNGSGKTTLLKALVGLLKPGAGRIEIDGVDVAGMKLADVSRKVGFVLQNPNDQLFAPTVGEDVAYGPGNLGLTEGEVAARVDEALGLVSATHLKERAIHHISYGEQKRVAIAGVLAMRPDILILDEPTAGLDPAGETAMMKLLNDLNHKRGITVVLATHSVDMLPVFADRIYVMKDGRMLRDGAPYEIFRDQELISGANLRLPYISGLLYEMKHLDGVPIGDLPLTVREARTRLLELLPDEIIASRLKEGA